MNIPSISEGKKAAASNIQFYLKSPRICTIQSSGGNWREDLLLDPRNRIKRRAPAVCTKYISSGINAWKRVRGVRPKIYCIFMRIPNSRSIDHASDRRVRMAWIIHLSLAGNVAGFWQTTDSYADFFFCDWPPISSYPLDSQWPTVSVIVWSTKDYLYG